MAKLSVGDKGERTLRFMLGLTNPRILAQLMTRGFTLADYEEGWTLLRATGKTRLAATAPTAKDPSTLTALDDWENTWFPIADATLTRHYPAVRDRLFLNLTQTEGIEVIFSTTTFTERLAEMGLGTGGYGEEGKAARALLDRRGLNAAAIGQAEELLKKLGPAPAGVPPAPPQQTPEEFAAEVEKAEQAMWAWYLEWSEIARRTISSRRELRDLGFLGTKGRSSVEPADPDKDAPPAEPAT